MGSIVGGMLERKQIQNGTTPFYTRPNPLPNRILKLFGFCGFFLSNLLRQSNTVLPIRWANEECARHSEDGVIINGKNGTGI